MTNLRTDYSALFNNNSTNMASLTSSIIGSSTTGASDSITDYASIKNGSYSKLVKAYYAKQDSDAASSTKKTANTKKTESKTDSKVNVTKATLSKADQAVSNAASALGKTASSLSLSSITQDSRETLNKDITSFVDSYNSLVKNASDSTNKDVLRQTAWLTQITGTNEKLLSSIGIQLNADNTLTVNKTTLDKASLTTLNSVFTDNNSWNSQVMQKASKIVSILNTKTNDTPSYVKTGNYTEATTPKLYDSQV